MAGGLKNRFSGTIARAGPRSRAFVAAAAALVLLGHAPEAHARSWWWAKTRGGRSNWSFALDLGARLNMQYSRSRTLASPPQTLLGEGQVTFWYRANIGFYLTFGRSLVRPQTVAGGGGVKFPFLTLAGQNAGFIKGISMILLTDVVYYSTVDPVAPHIFVPRETIFRYGASMLWAVGRGGFYLNTTMMITIQSNSFLIVPYAGIGKAF